MESLLTSFRRERQREENKTESGADEVYKSTWFAFSSMGFLQDKFAVKKTVNTEELSYQNNEERHINTEGNCNPTAKPRQNQEPDGASTDKDESTTTPSSSRRKKSRFLDPSAPNQRNQSRADKAYDLMMEINEKRCSRDESSTYGDHIAAKHRKYSQHTKSVVEHLVGEILFKADMGLYEKEFTTPHSQPQNRFYNPYKQHNISNTHTWPSPSLSYTYSSHSPSPSTSSQTSDTELHQNTYTPTIDLPPPQSIHKVAPVPPEDSDFSPLAQFVHTFSPQ